MCLKCGCVQEVCPAGYKKLKALESDDDPFNNEYPPIDICNRTQVVDFMSSNTNPWRTPTTGLQYLQQFTTAETLDYNEFYVSNWQALSAVQYQYYSQPQQVSKSISFALLFSRPL